jgi:hypothetical protein
VVRSTHDRIPNRRSTLIDKAAASGDNKERAALYTQIRNEDDSMPLLVFTHQRRSTT